MKKHSMLVAGTLIIAISIFGIVISTLIQPITPAMLTTSIFTLLLIVYIEICKRRILVESYVRESYLLFFLLIVTELYFTIIAFTTLVYLNQFKSGSANQSLHLKPLIVGLTTLSL